MVVDIILQSDRVTTGKTTPDLIPNRKVKVNDKFEASIKDIVDMLIHDGFPLRNTNIFYKANDGIFMFCGNE